RSRDRIHVDSVAASVQRVTGFEITLAGGLLHGRNGTGLLRGGVQAGGNSGRGDGSADGSDSGGDANDGSRAAAGVGPGAYAGCGRRAAPPGTQGRAAGGG